MLLAVAAIATLLGACIQRGDAMPPSVAIREPRSGATSTTENLRIVGYAFDDEGIAAIRVDGVDLLAAPSYASERGKRLVEFFFTIRDLTDGDVTVLIEAEDTRGRVTVMPYRLRLDSTPPTLELTSVTALGGGRLRVEGIARDNTLLTSVLINGVPLAFTPAPEHAFRVDVSDDGNGGEIVVVDAAGNVTRRPLQ
ncbi:MAG: hypothetical protein O3A02_00765 [bacterium]|nr:hypothetical protein [bacterium]